MAMRLCAALLLALAAAGTSSSRLPPAPTPFRLYAPRASSVIVKPLPTPLGGGWSAVPMARDSAAPGYWNASVAGMRPGDSYVFTVDGTDRVDPSGLDISKDSKFSIVPAPYKWRNARKVVKPADSVIYEMQVGSFTPAGTLASAAAKLPYLAELGITVVELMPIMHYCGPADSWGYCPRAPYAVRPELGGSYGLKAFVDAAADLNMSVAIDIVWNHAAGDSVLVNYDTPSDGTNCHDAKGECGTYFAHGAPEMTPWGPRPNFADPNIRAWIVDQLRLLIDEFHIGSFRWDSTGCIRQVGAKLGDSGCNADNSDGWKLMQEANAMSHAGAQAGTFTVAEDTWGSPYAAITAAVSDTSTNNPPDTSGGAGFDAEWGYPFYFAATQEVTKSNNDQIDLAKVMDACVASTGKAVIFSENHDISSNQDHGGVYGRIPHRVDVIGRKCDATIANRIDCGAKVGAGQPSCEAAGCCWAPVQDPTHGTPWCFHKSGNPDPAADPNRYWAQKKAMLLLGLVLTCPGSPMLLQGQELLSYDSFDFPTPPKLDWSLADTNAGMLRESRDMIALRSNREGRSYGASPSTKSSCTCCCLTAARRRCWQGWSVARARC